MHVTSVDVYLTYKCNLRCTHCFVGDNLDSARDFPYQALIHLIDTCQQWKTEELTFLGGEPTLYPQIVNAVKAVQAAGAHARIVTNGLHGFEKFMRTFDGPILPEIGFSIDGSNPITHNLVRGPRAFERMLPNIERARELGYKIFGITSISQTNVADALEILKLCDRLGFSHVNVHYVTNRGFATEAMVLGIDEWLSSCNAMRTLSSELSLDIRLEQTFVTPGNHKAMCAVRERSNLMFLPDGRVFMCPMFIDVPNAHSFTWSQAGLEQRVKSSTEQQLCQPIVSVHCPAIQHVNNELNTAVAERGMQVSCVLAKTRLRHGRAVDDVRK